MKEIQRLQKTATKLILSEKQDYQQQLVTLNLLPLSLYIEMHDLFYLIALKQVNTTLNCRTYTVFRKVPLVNIAEENYK